MLHFFYHVMEIIGTLKAPVNGGKANIGDLIQFVEFLHHHFPDFARRDLSFTQAQKLLHNAIDCRINVTGWNRTLMQCAHEAGKQFLAGELCTVTILLYYLGHPQLDRLISRKTFVAGKAATAAAYSVAFLAHSRIDYASVFRTAKWTFHASL
jgi:hypothetical protein